jgi:cytoskeletal protein CcmA (bactofilin family)
MFMLTMARRTPAPRPGQNVVAHEEAGEPPTFLGPGTAIHGALEIDGELVVSGQVKGRIAARRLVITADGYVEGDIIAGEVVIAGRLNGRVFSPTVVIEDGAEIEGRIFHTNVTVARGARVTGRMPWRPLSYFETLDKLPEVRA